MCWVFLVCICSCLMDSTYSIQIRSCCLARVNSALRTFTSLQMNTQNVDPSIPNSPSPLWELDYPADWKINRRKWHWLYGLFLNACIWVYWLRHENDLSWLFLRVMSNRLSRTRIALRLKSLKQFLSNRRWWMKVMGHLLED